MARYTFELFFLHLQGWHEAQKEYWRRTATTNAVLINLHSKRKVTVEDMMGESRAQAPLLPTKAAFEAHMRARIEAAQKAAQDDSDDY